MFLKKLKTLGTWLYPKYENIRKIHFKSTFIKILCYFVVCFYFWYFSRNGKRRDTSGVFFLAINIDIIHHVAFYYISVFTVYLFWFFIGGIE